MPIAAQYTCLAVFWSTSFALIKVGLVEGLSPPQVVWSRLVIGATVLAFCCCVTRAGLPRRLTVWGHLAVVSALGCLVPFLVLAWAEQHVSSALASILNATTPLTTALAALVLLPGERVTRTALAGLLAGLAGVAVVMLPRGAAGEGSAAGAAACCLTAACYGVAYVYLRRYVRTAGVSPLPVATLQVGLSAAVVTVVTPTLGPLPDAVTPRLVVAMVALGAGGTGFAYLWNAAVVTSWGPARAATVTFVIPLLGAVIGAVWLREPLSWPMLAGGVLIVSGVALTRGAAPGHRLPGRGPSGRCPSRA